MHCERNTIVHLDLDEKLQDAAVPSPSDSSVSCNNAVSVFVHFKDKTTFFLLICTIESVYIQGNKTESFDHVKNEF